MPEITLWIEENSMGINPKEPPANSSVIAIVTEIGLISGNPDQTP